MMKLLMLLLIGMVKLKLTVLGIYLLLWHKLYEINSLDTLINLI